MDLKSFLGSMPPPERERFALSCGTTAGHLRNVMYGYKPCATDLAVMIWKQSRGLVTRQELRTDWARHWPELIGTEGALDFPAAAAAPAEG